MTGLKICTLSDAQQTRNRGCTEEQATGGVVAFKKSDAARPATISRLEDVVSDLKVEIVRRLVVAQGVLAGFRFAAMKFSR